MPPGLEAALRRCLGCFPRSVDLSEALSLPGVVDIITADHLQDANAFTNPFAPENPETLLAADEVLPFCFLFEQLSQLMAPHIFIGLCLICHTIKSSIFFEQ